MAAMVIRRPEGDGTVPRVSAQFRGSSIANPEAFTAPHAECYGVPEFLTATVARINDLLATM
jgi:hypothetical protein